MCLIVFSYREHSDYRLILAANRDEFYARPTAALMAWEDAPGIIAGRDKLGRGTWLGITRAGRFAAVTNYRDPPVTRPDAPSRGLLVSDFLRGRDAPRAYMENLRGRAHRYQGFSLLVGDVQTIYYFCNRDNDVRELGSGTYGLSNRLLDTPWPKVWRAKRALNELIRANAVTPAGLLELLMDTRKASDQELPDTGVGLALERQLSPIFISGDAYGTRSSTALLITNQGDVSVTERAHPQGEITSFEWRLDVDYTAPNQIDTLHALKRD